MMCWGNIATWVKVAGPADKRMRTAASLTHNPQQNSYETAITANTSQLRSHRPGQRAETMNCHNIMQSETTILGKINDSAPQFNWDTFCFDHRGIVAGACCLTTVRLEPTPATPQQSRTGICQLRLSWPTGYVAIVPEQPRHCCCQSCAAHIPATNQPIKLQLCYPRARQQ